jgi:hypothetical protein
MNKPRCWLNLLAVLLLWAFFAQTVTSMVVKSPTVDEQAHLMRGYVYLELGDLRFKIGHPILANTLNAIPLWTLIDRETLRLPTDDPAWVERRWGPFADRLFWQPGTDVALIFFLGRLVTVALGALFAALVFRWARQLWGGYAGLVALALFVFDPTILAHSRFTTDDIAVSFFYFAATYGLWRYLEMDRARDLVLTGVAFGLAQGCKFSALLLVPVFIATVGLWPFLHAPTTGLWWGRLSSLPWKGQCAASRRRWLLGHAVGLLKIFAIGGLTLWAVYRFDFRALPGWPLPVPAAAYFEDLIWESKYFGREGYVFLCGKTSATGWWYYSLVAFALKSPLPAMLLPGAAAIGLRRGANRPRLMALLLPAFIYLLSTLVVSLNIGYRFFIPVLPYLYVLAGRLAASAKKGQRLLLTGALLWSALIALCIHPHHLAYFNELAGGPDGGWRYLVDSNIDWGQDLPALHDVIRRRNLGQVRLSYFGTAHPSYYDIDFEPLPTWEPTPEQGNPFTRTYYPHDPAPGVYAISATHLQGVVMAPDKWDTYAWFRDRPPFAKAGYSIFLYQVGPTGPPVDVALSGLQVDDLAPETFAAFGTNDVRLRWFDAHTSLVIPAQPGWYAVREVDAADNLDAWGWNAMHPCATTAGGTCRLYLPDPGAHAAAVARVERLVATSKAWHSAVLAPSSDERVSPLALPINMGHQLQFLGYEPSPHPPTDQLADPPTTQILTAWRVTAPPDGPRAIFVHLLTPDGLVVAQWDGLDVPVEGWREGDSVLQVSSLGIPADLPPGRYWLQAGVYNPATMERLPVLVDGTAIADRILLSPLEVPGQ